MRPQSLRILLPVSSAGLVASLPVFFIACDYLLIDKTKVVTARFIAIWIVLGVLGSRSRRISILRQPLVCLCFLGFLSLYYVNWALMPKGTSIDDLMLAYSVANAIIPFIFGSLFERRDIRIFFVVIALWGTLLAALVLVGYIANAGSETMIDRFTVGESLNPITQSFVIGFVLVVLYSEILTKSRYRSVPAMAILLFTMLLGGSRGPVIALLAALSMMTFFTQRTSRKIFAILLIAVSLVIIPMYLPETTQERYFSEERWLTTRTEEGMPLRIERATLALELWLQAPILGAGTSENELVYYSHNLIIQILLEMGVIGLVLFLSILIPPLLNFFRSLRIGGRAEWDISAFTGLLVYCLIEAQVSGTYMNLNLLWFSMGILTAWPQIIPSSGRAEASTLPHVYARGVRS